MNLNGNLYDLSGNLIGDTNILDLDQSVFTGSDIIFEEALGSEIFTPEIEETIVIFAISLVAYLVTSNLIVLIIS